MIFICQILLLTPFKGCKQPPSMWLCMKYDQFVNITRWFWLTSRSTEHIFLSVHFYRQQKTSIASYSVCSNVYLALNNRDNKSHPSLVKLLNFVYIWHPNDGWEWLDWVDERDRKFSTTTKDLVQIFDSCSNLNHCKVNCCDIKTASYFLSWKTNTIFHRWHFKQMWDKQNIKENNNTMKQYEWKWLQFQLNKQNCTWIDSDFWRFYVIIGILFFFSFNLGWLIGKPTIWGQLIQRPEITVLKTCSE